MRVIEKGSCHSKSLQWEMFWNLGSHLGANLKNTSWKIEKNQRISIISKTFSQNKKPVNLHHLTQYPKDILRGEIKE